MMAAQKAMANSVVKNSTMGSQKYQTKPTMPETAMVSRNPMIHFQSAEEPFLPVLAMPVLKGGEVWVVAVAGVEVPVVHPDARALTLRVCVVSVVPA